MRPPAHPTTVQHLMAAEMTYWLHLTVNSQLCTTERQSPPAGPTVADVKTPYIVLECPLRHRLRRGRCSQDCCLGNDPSSKGIMPKELAKRKAAGVDNTNRRTWDVDEFADKAATREAEVGTMLGNYTTCKGRCSFTNGSVTQLTQYGVPLCSRCTHNSICRYS